MPLILAWAMLPVGCSPRPRAPVLKDEPVYQNDKEGFRFLVPDGWKIHARADAPPGSLHKEATLVNYKRHAGKGSAFLVTAADLPASADLTEHLSRPSYGAARWKPTSAPEQVKVGDADGQRQGFTGQVGKEERGMEAVSVRRGGRVYFFKLLYSPADREARDQARRVVESVIWKK